LEREKHKRLDNVTKYGREGVKRDFIMTVYVELALLLSLAARRVVHIAPSPVVDIGVAGGYRLQLHGMSILGKNVVYLLKSSLLWKQPF